MCIRLNIKCGVKLKQIRPEVELLALLNFSFSYDTAKPYGPSNVLKSILVTRGADSGSSPETYNRANHLSQQVG